MENESNQALHRLTARSFVGRERELTELYSGLADAAAGRGRVFLIAGEPGIGKTRLAEELTAEAARRGAQVLWGRCWEGGGAPAYWPWVQIIRAVLRDRGPAARTELLGDTAGLIAQLVPELIEWQPDLPAPTPPALSSEHARFAQFGAVGGLLKRAGAARPLVLILDDLHASDQPSLLLLQFIARELRDAHLLIAGTYRDIEMPSRPECAQTLAAIAREGHRVPLGGLSADDVARFITAGFALAPSRAVVAAVHQTTEGNPLFIDEVVRTLVVQHAARLSEIPPDGLPIPHGVGDAIRQRLRPLSPACRRVLNIAAVLGREFDFAPLLAMCERPAAQLLDLLGEASTNAIVTTLPGASSRYSFQHTLIRETLYSDLSPSERARMHQQVAEILERLDAADLAPHYAEIAHHFLHATPLGDPHQAISYAVRAGERAAALFAYEEAAIQFERALEALALTDTQTDAAGCEVLLGLGEAQLGSGRDQDARATFAHAATIARRLAAPALLARAALGFADRGVGAPQSIADPTVAALIEEALAGLGSDPTAVRARLLARLAAELAVSDRERGITLVGHALAMARELADPVTLAHVLSAQHFVLWRSDYLADRLTIADEITQLGDRLGDRELAIQGRMWRLIDLMNGGDGDRLDAELATYPPLAAALGRSRYRWMGANLRAMRALWRGQWTEAIALAQEATPLAERAEIRLNPLVQAFVAQRELRQLEGQLPMLHVFVERYPFSPVPRTFLALVHRELDQEAEARYEFEQVAHHEFADLQRERRLGVLPYLSEVCAYLRDNRRAAILYDLLLPYVDSTIAYAASVSFGAATHYLGILAATMARWDDAARHFEDALARNARMDGPPWLARTQYAYTCALLTRGRVGDHLRARDLAAHALATAEALGMVSLAMQLRTLDVRTEGDHAVAELEEPIPVAAASGGLRLVRSARTISPQSKRRQPEPHAGSDHQQSPAKDNQLDSVRGLFHFEGQYWSVGSGATLLRLKDSKGLRCLSQLLQHPGREFHATDLAAPATASATAIEGRARTTDKQRIEDLRDQLDEATRFNDLGRASKLREEIEMFADQLAAGAGLGNRGSARAADAERARVNVTRAIKTTIKRISDGDAHLGRYLATTIKTGTYCSYRPDPRLPIRWQF
ncbi:MAG: AAA family ATPase [Deltaproteobacteria bacterium]|nr:AAA family ATPase [Deltaproteobacteria bacterium]MBI3386550.1 AAA family ATPase [Deltaproteobacteria bacterium]